jgi:phosphatidyl-myo-inositol dimannoside synthase
MNLNIASFPPRVAFLVPSLRGRGGWATFARGAIGALSRHVEPVLIVGQADEATARATFPSLEIHAVPVVYPEDWSGTSVSLLRRILPALFAIRRLPHLNVAIVHALEMFPAGWLGVALADRERAPLILTAHGTYAVLWKSWRMLDLPYRFVLRNAAAICPVSHGTEERLRGFYQSNLRHASVRVIANGTDAAGRIPRADVIARIWPEAPMVLTVGGVKPRKGHDVSLRAFSILQRKYPLARYRIAGLSPSDDFRNTLEMLIRQESIRHVEFLGAVDDAALDRLYRESSLFLLLSQEEGLHFEGFGLAYLEAGAYGLPVIGTRTGGIPDAVRDGETGCLVAAGDAAAAGEAMILLASDEQKARRMGLAGRAFAEELTWDRFAKRQTAVYESVLISPTYSTLSAPGKTKRGRGQESYPPS